MNNRADYMDGGMNGVMDPGMSGMGMNGRGQYQAPLQRGICRDYHSEFLFLSIISTKLISI